MEYEYDAETDVLVIKLRAEKPDFGEQEGSIIAHYNKDNKPVEIEILDASKTTLDMLRAMIPKKELAEA